MTTHYPNATLHKFVMDNFTGLIGLKLVSIENKKAWSHDGSDQGEHWMYNLQCPNSNTLLKISLHWPKTYVFISFHKDTLWFSFDNYLSKIGKRKELDDILARMITDKDIFSSEDGAIETLKLFHKYLLSDLLKVARGEEWREIPIDYMGYK